MLASVFHHPMDLSTIVALWLVLPLVVAVAVCYKTLRTRNVRRLPLEAAALVGATLFEEAAQPLAPGPHIDKDVAERSKERVSVDVGPDDDHWYYRFFETGAGAHEITGSPLVFEGREDLVVTGRVDHPGMAAQPFLRPAFDGEKDRATDAVGDELRKAVER